MDRAYTHIDVPIPRNHNELDDDARTRIASFLCKHVREIAPGLVPDDVRFMVVAHRFLGGEPYPAIGMFSEFHDDLVDLALELQEQLGNDIRRIGIQKLLEYSSAEEVSWKSILYRD